jgi:hypothetical protein
LSYIYLTLSMCFSYFYLSSVRKFLYKFLLSEDGEKVCMQVSPYIYIYFPLIFLCSLVIKIYLKAKRLNLIKTIKKTRSMKTIIGSSYPLVKGFEEEGL